jgi:DNA (cytosine-5)-methyltransferase 1
MGYSRAGFDVVGIDIKRQRRYPFRFIQADALEVLSDLAAFGLSDAVAIHASPPCQLFSDGARFAAKIYGAKEHPNLIPPTRAALVASGLPHVIENVPRAPLINPVRLCGSSFGRPLKRHRNFESTSALLTPGCAHQQLRAEHRVGMHSHRSRTGVSRFVGVYGKGHHAGDKARWSAAMGIDWMTLAELSQAIPPDYTELIGRQLMQSIRVAA